MTECNKECYTRFKIKISETTNQDINQRASEFIASCNIKKESNLEDNDCMIVDASDNHSVHSRHSVHSGSSHSRTGLSSTSNSSRAKEKEQLIKKNKNLEDQIVDLKKKVTLLDECQKQNQSMRIDIHKYKVNNSQWQQAKINWENTDKYWKDMDTKKQKDIDNLNKEIENLKTRIELLKQMKEFSDQQLETKKKEAENLLSQVEKLKSEINEKVDLEKSFSIKQEELEEKLEEECKDVQDLSAKLNQGFFLS